MQNMRGFALIEISIILILIIALCTTGFFVYRNNDHTNPPTPTHEATPTLFETPTPVNKLTTYTSSELGITFTHPETYTVVSTNDSLYIELLGAPTFTTHYIQIGNSLDASPGMILSNENPKTLAIQGSPLTSVVYYSAEGVSDPETGDFYSTSQVAHYFHTDYGYDVIIRTASETHQFSDGTSETTTATPEELAIMDQIVESIKTTY